MPYKLLLILVFLLSYINVVSQNSNNSYLELNFAKGVHGSGDMTGFQYGILFAQSFSKKLDWTLSFEGSLHDDPDTPLFYSDEWDPLYNSTLHNITSGLQLGAGVRFNIVDNRRHLFGLGLSSIFRYQVTSLPDVTIVEYPAITGLPYPVRVFITESPYRTFAVGGSLKLYYGYKVSDKYTIGTGGSFQIDTNGDTIGSYFISVSRKF